MKVYDFLPSDRLLLQLTFGLLLSRLGIARTSLALLSLLVKFLPLQRLQETLHTAAYHSVETKTVAAHVAVHIGWVQTIRTYIQRVCFLIIHILQFVPILIEHIRYHLDLFDFLDLTIFSAILRILSNSE